MTILLNNLLMLRLLFYLERQTPAFCIAEDFTNTQLTDTILRRSHKELKPRQAAQFKTAK